MNKRNEVIINDENFNYITTTLNDDNFLLLVNYIYNKNKEEIKNKSIYYDLGIKKMIVTNKNQVFHLSKKTQNKLRYIADKISLLQKKSSAIYEIRDFM